jgi:hypothetical protein
MTHPFAQTDEEKSLYRDVTEFMRQEISFTFPHRQRHLIELILFKTLASSPQALAGTLRTMRQRLVDLRDGLTEAEQDRFLNALTVDYDIDVESLMEEIDEFEKDKDGEDRPVDGRLLATELAEIDSLIDRAERITSDSKSKALLKSLEAAFVRLQDLGAKRKA